MRLTEFIQNNHKSIVEQWVEFAVTMLPWSDGMSHKDLKDHAEELLTAVVSDMRLPQNDSQKLAKSKGEALDGRLATVGHQHASDRLETGLNLSQLVSEFRALRASVLRLWEEAQGEEQDEVTRFNEAIDEILATSTTRYSDTVQNTREQFLAILSHDLRNPIGAITMGAELLVASGDPDIVAIASSIQRSGEKMHRMVNDLLDLTRSRLGKGIPIALKPMELASVCLQAISELQAIHPERQIRFESSGDLFGEWDSDRLAQVVSNLVANAIQYGSPTSPVGIDIQKLDENVVMRVHNEGVPIPKTAIKSIFNPMYRYRTSDKNITGLGLGLYIAKEIVEAHGGKMHVTSSAEDGTTFFAEIPSHPNC